MQFSKLIYVAISCLMLIIVGVTYVGRSRIDPEPNLQIDLKNPITQILMTTEVDVRPSYLDELTTLLAKHFADDYSDPITHLAMLMDSDKYDNLIRINYLRNLVIDLGISIESLDGYGLVKLDIGTYEIDNQKHPGWLTLDSLFSALYSINYSNNSLTPILLRNGFGEENLTAFKTYLDNSNLQLELAMATLKILDEELAKIESIQFDQTNREIYTLFTIRINELANKVTGVLLKNWAIKLMEQLDNQGQLILFNYVFENSGTSGIISSSITESVDGLIDEISSGKLRNEYRDFINGLPQTTESLR